jgi:L-alanine-DL-glutamate epimerase-like enolase superfamily enzyme
MTTRTAEAAATIDATVHTVEAAAYTIPTDAPESDGTIAWDSTTIVVVHLRGGGESGVGYSYADAAAAALIRHTLAPIVIGRRVTDIEGTSAALAQACRNLGRAGIAAYAISAIDIALWDLKARLLDVPLAALLGAVRQAVPLYGSGGFTSYSLARLEEQLGGWARDGLRAVKMKIGRDAAADDERVRAARRAIGPATELFVDANGAYTPKQALDHAGRFIESGVTWFEEPVSSDDLDGLRFLRERMPAPIDVAAGEYGHDAIYFGRMLAAGSVDVLQADATRCGGITGFLKAGALCDAWQLPLSAHTSPAVHVHVCAAVPRVRHLEYFHDHVRIESMLFDGVLPARDGLLYPDRSRPGLGIEFKSADASRFAVH